MKDIASLWEQFTEVFSHTFLTVEIWRLILAGVVLIITMAIRKLFVNLLVMILKRMTSKTKTTVDDQLVDAIDPPARLIVIALGLHVAFRVMQYQMTPDSFLGHLVRTLLIFSVFWAVYRAAGIIAGLFEKAVKKTETTLDDMLLPYINKGIKIVVVIVAISTIAKEWQYDLGAILTGLGLGGLAFALAAQETLANFFGGLTLMLDKPFAVGDWIFTPNVEGTVEDIGFRSTKVRTFAQALVTVPNATLAKAPITNWSRMGKRRISFNLGVKLSTTHAQMEELLNRVRTMLETHPEIHKQTIFVFFDKYGNSAYELFFYFFTITTSWQRFLEVKEDVNLKLMRILDELGVEVAFPSTSVYMEKGKEITERKETPADKP